MPSFVLPVLLCAGLILCLSTPVAAFGAGNIINVSQVAGKNWRHGDIEDVLLELLISTSGGTRFDKLAVKRVYFGNWLRDYSQAIDVGGLKQLPKDTIRILLWVLSFVTFGFATGEFEVTEERLGCYRPEEHIDNPKDYADNEDARKYDSRLRGPVDEGKELSIDERTGMKTYIASEDRGIETSAGLVRRKFTEAIEKGRAYGRDGNKNDLYEALRLLGTGLHCLEDYSAHSNYVELALREMGVDAFPHVGSNTEVEVNGKKIWPLVTGTFGMTDFLHSVVGEVSDKVVQSEVQDLDAKLAAAEQQSQSSGTTSTLKKILDNIPFALLGLGDSDFGNQADKLQQDATAKKLEQTSISDGGGGSKKVAGMDVGQLKTQAAQTMKDIYPVLEFHDKVMKAMQKGIDKIPGASDLLENLTGAMQIFVFSILAPYVKPILARVKTELAAGSGGVLTASENAQFNVFDDGNSSNPTHSVLSKDHFTNLLNPIAGRVASEVVKFATPLIVSAWEDPNRDANQICDEILQVFHHPALRDGGKQGHRAMYEAVENWWNEKDNDSKEHLKQALSRDGVREGKNHEGEDPNPGPGGCGHSHGGMKASGGSSQQNQSRRDQQESSRGNNSGGGGGYNAPSRSHQEESSYGGGGGGGGDGSSRNRQEESSYGSGGNRQKESTYGDNSGGGGGGGYNAPSRSHQESSYGSGNRQEESTYGSGGGGSYNAPSRSRQEESSYGSGNRQEESTYGSGGGGSYNSPSRSRQEESSYGSGNRQEESTYNPPSRSRQEESTYGSGGGGSYNSASRSRQEESSYGSGGGSRQESSYGTSDSYGSSNRQQTPSYGGGGSRNNDNEDFSGSSARHWGGEETTTSYSASRETSSYSRNEEQTDSYGGNETSSYRQETSSYGRDNQDSSSHGRGTSGYGGNQETRSQRRQGGEEQEEEGSGGYGGGGGGGYSNY